MMVESKMLVLGQVILCLVTRPWAVNGKGPGLEKHHFAEASNQIRERQGKENNPCK